MIPIEDNLCRKVFPAVTLLLVVTNLLIYAAMVLVYGSPEEFLSVHSEFCVVPGAVVGAFQSLDLVLMLSAVISIFTAMFLHASWMHVIGNMAFLWAFGRGVESRLGRTRYVAFYLVCGIGAALAHILNDPTSFIPCLGASGAIAGVLGGYLVFWPKAEITGVQPAGPLVAWSYAYFWLLPWFLLQLLAVWLEAQGGDSHIAAYWASVTAGHGGVAYWAHIGGFVTGWALAAMFRQRNPASDAVYLPIYDCPADEEIVEQNTSEQN